MFKSGDLVESRTEPGLGRGVVKYVEEIAGVVMAGVKWDSGPEGSRSAADLKRIEPLANRLAECGPASRVPFQLKMLAHWFEARHALTGELSSQPFQMLPHQVIVTNRVVKSAPENRAWLIADDVGLGKTIEAGMILEVLRKRTLGAFRCLVLTPAGLTQQWRDELKLRFSLSFSIFRSTDPNELETAPLLIASIDTLKSKKFVAMTTAEHVRPWDLLIVDEAHHLATSRTSNENYKFLRSLRESDKAKNVLFLSATPHSGKNEEFFNMLRLLRSDLFPEGRKDYPEVPLRDVMIRNRKSQVTDAKGERIFQPIGEPKIIPFRPTPEEVLVYEQVHDYLKNGYKEAERLNETDKKSGSAVGFVMTTFSKLASSSRAAITQAIERRYEVLTGEHEEAQIHGDGDARYPGEAEEKDAVTGGLVGGRGKKRTSLIKNELKWIDQLKASLEGLRRDSKLEAFLKKIETELTPAEDPPKLLIFTEYRATQEALIQALGRVFGGDTVAYIHGSMSMDQRRAEVARFNLPNEGPRFLVSTEAGGEGLNMQSACHIVVNYDLPWNPMDLQQRIGRVYRYGQRHPVVVYNLKIESESKAFADQKIFEYLEKKIVEITKSLEKVQGENPDDIRGEVLGRLHTGSLRDAYQAAIVSGEEKAKIKIDETTSALREILEDKEGMLSLFKGLPQFNLSDYDKAAAKVSTEQLAFFVHQYLGHVGQRVTSKEGGLIAFESTEEMRKIADVLVQNDPVLARDPLAKKIELATVDKELAQQHPRAKLLRFGHPAFEAMVRHAQYSDFSNGAAAFDLPARVLGVSVGSVGTWAAFDLRIVRAGDHRGDVVVDQELAAFWVPRGGAPVSSGDALDPVIEHLHEALSGPSAAEIDVAEARRAYEAAKRCAEERLGELRQRVLDKYGANAQDKIAPKAIQDVGLAWIRAVEG